ncbi:MAG: hypothetical protein KBD50_02620 [Candidatus Pacebacteria bacterium]|nr:hypothetical protein [Candidatus Paceibacterota bacterium]
MQTSTVSERPPIEPLVKSCFKVPGSTVQFTAACFEGSNWSLGPLQEPEDVAKNPDLAERLNNALRGLGATIAMAPNPTAFNGQVISPVDLTRNLKLGEVHMRCNRSWPADATFLHYYGNAGVFSAGGCGVMVIGYRNQLMFGHAGRESLIDRRCVETEGQDRSRSGDLVDNMLDALDVDIDTAKDVWAWPLFFIKPQDFVHRFDDPDARHAPYNQAAARYLPRTFAEFGWIDSEAIYIDLPKIATSQLMKRGVPRNNINLDHAYLADELPTTRKGGGRYLVAIVRC